jgi:hypothetical protein
MPRSLGRPLYECRFAASTCADALRPTDMKLVDRLIRESRTWTLVDGLAASVAGVLVERYPELSKTLGFGRRLLGPALRPPRTSRSPRPGEGDFARFGRHADAVLEEREVFIRKDIGWCFATPPGSDPISCTAGSSRVQAAPRATAHEAVSYLSDGAAGGDRDGARGGFSMSLDADHDPLDSIEASAVRDFELSLVALEGSEPHRRSDRSSSSIAIVPTVARALSRLPQSGSSLA